MAEYIEREALLKHAHIGMTRVSDTEWQQGYWDGVDDMAEYIREQPAADVEEVRHGEWEYPFNRDIAKCTVCDFCVQDKINNVSEMYKFCPSCGADMRGKKK